MSQHDKVLQGGRWLFSEFCGFFADSYQDERLGGYWRLLSFHVVEQCGECSMNSNSTSADRMSSPARFVPHHNRQFFFRDSFAVLRVLGEFLPIRDVLFCQNCSLAAGGPPTSEHRKIPNINFVILSEPSDALQSSTKKNAWKKP